MFLVRIKAKKVLLGSESPPLIFSTVKLRINSEANPRRYEILLIFLSIKRGADLCRAQLV